MAIDSTLNKPKDPWAYYIDQANMHGDESLRKQYIKMREAGIDPNSAQNMGFDLGEGYSYNPFQGSLSYDSDPDTQGSDYSYSSKEDFTTYGGNRYKGYFDVDTLSQISSEDWKSAYDSLAPWEEQVLGKKKEGEDYNEGGMINDYADTRYRQELDRFGGLDGGAVDVDADKLYQKYGINSMYDEFYDEYNQRAMTSAYKTAWERANPGQAMGGRGTFDDLINQDWSSKYITNKSNPAAQDTKAMQAEMQAIYNNPAIQGYTRDKQIEAIKTKYGSTTPTASSWVNNQKAQTQGAALPVASQPPTPAPTMGPSVDPAEYEKSLDGSQLDWKGLYDQLNTYVTGLNNKSDATSNTSTTSSTKRDQLTNYYDYGPSYSKSSYKSSTPYSGKGA